VSIEAMTPYLLTVIDLVLRWLHVIVGISWVGSSFYFMWLDARLNVPPQHPQSDNVAGDLWALHGGGFYHSQKYKSAPGTIPTPLYRFKWEAYTTGLSGIALLAFVYYLNADLYLVSRDAGLLNPGTAIAASIVLIIAAWPVYHVLCVVVPNERLFAIIGTALVAGTAWLVEQLFTGRGAFMQLGAMLGMLMVANVFFNIMPAQRAMLASMRTGSTPDASLGARAKRRSVHNNYLTLPVVLCMLSPHYPLLYGQADNWLVLAMLMVAGGFARHYFNLRNAGRRTVVPLAVSLLICATSVVAIGYSANAGKGGAQTVTYREFKSIIDRRCRTCHSVAPTYPGTVVAPAGVALDNAADFRRWASHIQERVVVSHTMPNNNVTGITDDERRRVAAWFSSGMQAD
jgi:uncharacterized membrane protein